MADYSRPRASVSFTCTLGKRSAYRGRNFDKTLSIVCGGAATFSYPPVSAPKQVHPLAERVDVAQHVSTISEQLLTDGGQHKAASHTVKQLEA